MLAALLVLLTATAVAALCALAAGAIRALDADAPPSAAMPAERERGYRALGFMQLLALLTAGAGLARSMVPADDAVSRVVTWLLLAVGLLLIVVAGESAPRAIGRAMGARALELFAAPLRLARMAVSPVVGLAARLDNALERQFPRRPIAPADADAFTAQFRQVVATEAEVTREEASLLHGVFSLGDTVVADIMVPRVDVVGIDRTLPWSEVVDRIRSSEHARFPVYEETIDDVTGILYAKDTLPAVLAGDAPAAGWPALVRPALFIPGTKTLDGQLRDFKASRTHIAIVVDEYGGTAGIVTIEDILEEIVGEIRDEYDVEDPEVEQRGADRFWVSGRLTLGELSVVLDHDFERDDVSTVGGLIYERLGRVPRAGEEFTIGPYRVVVERVERRKVARVYFERIPAAAGRAGA